VSHDDPTDNALAAIASILDQTTTPPETAKVAEKAPAPVEEPPEAMPLPLPESAEPEQSEPAPPPVEPIEANGYSKAGPGPMAALRFRWTAREDNGRFYVDETFGEGTAPLVNGPMARDAAIKFVDDREAEARQRFEQLKHEMISRTALPSHDDHNEAPLVRDEDNEV
jgi:hypothetical protein